MLVNLGTGVVRILRFLLSLPEYCTALEPPSPGPQVPGYSDDTQPVTFYSIPC